MDRVVGRRVVVGREVRVMHETADELHLEGRTRLSPGQLVEVVFIPARSDVPCRRHALVICWAIAALGKEGSIYRGICRWCESRELSSR